MVLNKFLSKKTENSDGDIKTTKKPFKSFFSEITPLVKALTMGSTAALGSAQLTLQWGMPQWTLPISVAAFLGGAMYSLFSPKTQKAALLAIKEDGLVAVGAPIANGFEDQNISVLERPINQGR